MYFYIVEGVDYEDYSKDIYYSETLYTQEEFENIVTDAYKYVYEEIEAKRDGFYRCDDFLYSTFSWGNAYKKTALMSWIEDNSDLKIINEPNALMTIEIFTGPSESIDNLRKKIDFSKVPHCRDSCRFKKYGYWKLKCTYPDLRHKAKIEELKRKR